MKYIKTYHIKESLALPLKDETLLFMYIREGKIRNNSTKN